MLIRLLRSNLAPYRRQIEARRAAQAQQLVLFELKEDRRPASERTATGRYEEPTLLSGMRASIAPSSGCGASSEAWSMSCTKRL